jgi:hypothetical protein
MHPQRLIRNGQVYVLAADETPAGFTPSAFAKWKHDVRATMTQRIHEKPDRGKLVEAVLAYGGVAVVFAPADRNSVLDHFLPQLLQGGKLRRMPKRPTLLETPGKALPTALAMWQADPTRYGVEIGVARDERARGTAGLLWNEHVWLFDMPGQRYLEPERLRTQYYGVRLSTPECTQLYAQVLGSRQTVTAAATESGIQKARQLLRERRMQRTSWKGLPAPVSDTVKVLVTRSKSERTPANLSAWLQAVDERLKDRDLVLTVPRPQLEALYREGFELGHHPMSFTDALLDAALARWK